MNYEFEGKLLVFRVLIPLALGAFFSLLDARSGRKGLLVVWFFGLHLRFRISVLGGF